MVVADSSISFVDGTNGILEYRGYDIRVLAEHSTFRRSRLPAVERSPADGPGTGGDEAAVARLSLHAARDHRRAAQHASQRRPDGRHAHDGVDAGALRPGVGGQHAASAPAQGLPPAGAAGRACWRPTSASARGEEPVKPRMDLDHAANFLWMLTGEEPDPLAAKALDQYLLLLAEHELNASTFTARVIASTGSDLHSAITGCDGRAQGPGARRGGSGGDGAVPGDRHARQRGAVVPRAWRARAAASWASGIASTRCATRAAPLMKNVDGDGGGDRRTAVV